MRSMYRRYLLSDEQISRDNTSFHFQNNLQLDNDDYIVAFN